MEISTKEITAVEEAVNIQEQHANELSLLQLTLVGGGVGEVLFG